MSAQPMELPHSDEAEQAVLGSLLLTNDLITEVADLTAAHFYRTEHQRVFTVLRDMVAAGRTADAVTVAAEGGGTTEYLHSLAMSLLSPRNLAEYARIVVDRWIEREMLRCAAEISADAVALGDPHEKLDRAQAKFTVLATRRKSHDSVHIDQALVSFMDKLMAEAEGRTEVMATGMRDLDKLLAGGLRRGELMVLGARPKMGKTAFVLQLARNVAVQHPVLICSQEMPVHELTARHVAALGSINLADMRRPDLMTDEVWSRVSEAVEDLRTRKITMDEQRGLKLLDVRRKVMDAKRKHGVSLVIVDFLQLMVGDGDNRNQELDRISNGLKAMAGEFDVAVVLLSQMTRDADKRHGPPVMTDLRDCGAIEAAADIIGMLYREVSHPLGERGEEWKHYSQIEVVQRNGAPGSVSLWFSGEFQQFKDWSGGPPFKTAVRSGGGGRSRRVDLD